MSGEDLRVISGPRSGLTMGVAVHRTVDGRSLGGCRMWAYPSDAEAIADVERLAESMSYKAAAAGLDIGGGKGVIALEPGVRLEGEPREAALQDFAELVDSFAGRYVTAQDVGTTIDDTALMARFTRHVVGRAGLAGDPSPHTAAGVEVAIRASLRGEPLDGKRVVVIGAGHVGGALARRLATAGARLALTDVNPERRALADELGADWLDPGEALYATADVIAPCALGAVLDDGSVERIAAPIVAGAANNQLAHDGVAEALRARGVLWAPDFVVNAGGLIAVSDELWGYDTQRVERRIGAIADTLREVYTRTRTSTLVAAKELAAERLGA